MNHALIDSDIILDVVLGRPLFVKDSQIVLNRCLKGEIVGHITIITVANLHYILSKAIGNQKSLNYLKNLTGFLNILQSNIRIVNNALYSEFSDFEDSLQNYSAEEDKRLEFVLTRNTKDYKLSNLKVFTPSEFLKLNL